MSLETFAYGSHDLQTVTVARLPPYPASAPLHHTNTEDERNGIWVVLIHGGAWRDPTQTSTSYLTPSLPLLSSTQSQSETHTQTPTQEHPHPLKPAHISGLASISYRLSPHPSHTQDVEGTLPSHLRVAKHPDHLDDVQSALKFLQEKFRFGGRYILVGHSCGATLAFESVMRSLLNNYTGTSYTAPLAILGMAGIYDLRALRDKNKTISAYQEFIAGAFGEDEKVWDAVSPAVVSGEKGVQGWKEGKVVVLAHSKSDELCNIEQSEVMQAFLQEGWAKGEGREVRFLPIEGKHDEAWEKGVELARGILYTLERLQGVSV
ncbi:hypothetical protein BDW69DRAFT_167903 [Aspergillus filifer]